MVEHISSAAPAAAQSAQLGTRRVSAGVEFRRALLDAQRRTGEVRLSAHARHRLAQRDITLTPADMERVSKAVDRLASKGGREALVLMDSVGLILDVKNRTVVTAIGQQGLQEHVFTNIDSAAFA